MLIYKGPTQEFVEHNRFNRIADIMDDAFLSVTGRHAGAAEYTSWQNSLSRVRDVIEVAELNNNYIALEYSVPYNSQSRIDCLLFGRNNTADNVFLVELKQWTKVDATEIEGNYVETFTGGAKRIVPHPSQQVKGYHNYLLDFVEEFHSGETMQLTSCAYCHNYSRTDESGLLNPVYRKITAQFPVYCKEDLPGLAEALRNKLSGGAGLDVFNRFMFSRIRPSKKLLDNVRDVVRNGKQYSLLNEQLVAKNLILGKIRQGLRNNQKSVVLVQGGPGTGKSIIALNVLAEVADRKHTALFVCKSKPFREGLQKLVGATARNLFIIPYFLVPARAEESGLDVIFVDEAHRLEQSNVHRYMKPEHKSDLPQVDQIIRAARTSVFFIDDRQSVRHLEIGNSEVIREAAVRMNATVDEVELVSQFRCLGSNDYLLWVESVLGFSSDKRIFRNTEKFDFRIFDTPGELYEELKKKEGEKPGSARLMAGFCWPWSDPQPDGTLVNDVRIGDFAMPWETKGDQWAGDYPPWHQWAIVPRGFEQVGCIYTAQGFEFDYAGVIIGNDLVYDTESDSLKGNIAATRDPVLKRSKAGFENYVRNIYRVLLTRGMKGCYVYIADSSVKKYFISRTKNDNLRDAGQITAE
jgi:DUF2075 family protein